mgnify:CR=1 FL=1
MPAPPLEPAAPDAPAAPDGEAHVDDSQALMHMDEDASSAVVRLDAKISYASAAAGAGDDGAPLGQEADAQPLTQPIMEPERERRFALEEAGLPEVRFDRQFMLGLMGLPALVRNVAVVGHLHHGKTSLLDMLVEETHVMEVDVDKPLRYTDTHVIEPVSFTRLTLPTKRIV